MSRSAKPSQVEADLIASRARLVSSLTELRGFFSLSSMSSAATTLLTGAAKTSASQAGGLLSKLGQVVLAQVGKRL